MNIEQTRLYNHHQRNKEESVLGKVYLNNSFVERRKN